MYYYKISLTVLFMLFALNASSQSFSSKDLNEVLDKVKQYNIIGLGEAEHFRQGYYKSKVELIKHLVEHNTVDIIALEASMSGVEILNSYIFGETVTDLGSVLASLNEPFALQDAGLFDTAEIVEMVEWLKTHNAFQQRKVKLVGIDFQNYSTPLAMLDQYLVGRTEKLNKAQETKRLLDNSLRNILDSGFMVINTPEWLNNFHKAQNNVQTLKRQITNSKNADYLLELEQFTSLWDDPTFPRDSMMYTNLKKHLSLDSHVIVWGHNFHIENDPAFNGPKKLGVFLKENYPNNYFVIGVSDLGEDKNTSVIYPYLENAKYDMMIKVDRGDKCERLLPM